jgi:hypothetical protein
MDFQTWLETTKDNMHNHISTKDISYLKELDQRIIINKKGKFSYYNVRNELHIINM